MAIDYKPEQNDYTNLTPFKTWLVNQINTWGINNFPFLESDFDKLTNYGMMMKLMKAMNDVIGNQNEVEDDMSKLYEAFTELQTYINNYFDNLNVQEEINNKLNEMVEDGTFDTIINETLFNQLNNEIDILNSNRTVCIGDSYLRGDHNGISAVHGWGYFLQNYMDLSNSDFYIFSEGGAGFYKTGDAGHTFQTLLQANINSITDKSTIKHVIIAGGCNDRSQTENNILTAMENMIGYCKNQFPNATIYVGMIGNNASISDETYRRSVITRSLYCYKKCVEYGAKYLTGVEYLMHNYTYYESVDATHPMESGYNVIGKAIFNLINGYPYYESTAISSKQELTWNSDFQASSSSNNMGLTFIIQNTNKSIFINQGTAYVTASNIQFSNNLLKLTDTMPYALNYRNFYTNYTPSWPGYIYVKFSTDTNSTPIFGYYMVREHCLYFNAMGHNNKPIDTIYIPNASYNNDLLLT